MWHLYCVYTQTLVWTGELSPYYHYNHIRRNFGVPHSSKKRKRLHETAFGRSRPAYANRPQQTQISPHLNNGCVCVRVWLCDKGNKLEISGRDMNVIKKKTRCRIHLHVRHMEYLMRLNLPYLR